jgi:hypothetical protein
MPTVAEPNANHRSTDTHPHSDSYGVSHRNTCSYPDGYGHSHTRPL